MQTQMHGNQSHQYYVPYIFDTHSFIKSFVSAKSDEEKAEVIAKTISEIKQESHSTIDIKFDKAKYGTYNKT